MLERLRAVKTFFFDIFGSWLRQVSYRWMHCSNVLTECQILNLCWFKMKLVYQKFNYSTNVVGAYTSQQVLGIQ